MEQDSVPTPTYILAWMRTVQRSRASAFEGTTRAAVE